MASHVVVIDSSLRRATVKTTPGRHLSDVLEEACQKLGRRPTDHGLKYNKKLLDLSLTYRLSGLPSGAQLELIQASRSPSVVNVALQLPDFIQTARLTDKFPSNVTLWQLLRRFESGVAGSGQATPKDLNLTQRAVPALADGRSGAGRLYYETPVLNMMGRELSTFVDLQKSLAQLGFSGGSCLIRLTFRNSEQPLEEAMSQILHYFKDTEQIPSQTAESSDAHTSNSVELKHDLPSQRSGRVEPHSTAQSATSQPAETKGSELMHVPESPGLSSSSLPQAENSHAAAVESEFSAIPSSSGAPKAFGADSALPEGQIVIYAAPASNMPSAAVLSYSEADYEPTLDQAQFHQARLNTEGRNRRLLSDAEIAEAARVKNERINAVDKVQIRVKLPDEQIAEATFDRNQTAEGLYNWVQGLLRHGDQPFNLRHPNTHGRQVILEKDQNRLVHDLKFQGRVLIHMSWEDGVPTSVRRTAALKPELAGKAQQLQIPAPGVEADDERVLHPKTVPDKKKSGTKEDVENKMRKFLKFGKK